MAVESRIWNRMYTCAFLANFFLCVAQFLVNPLVATYAKTLGANEMMVGIVSGLYFGVAFAARPFSGPIITKMNKKHIMLFAYALGFVVNVGYAFSSNVALFVISRILHGVQFAFIGSLNLTLASDSLPPEKMGSGLGLFGVGGAVATAIAPGIGLRLRDLGETMFGSMGAGYTVVFAIAAACYAISIIPCVLMPYKPMTTEQKSSLGAWYKSIIAPEAMLPAVVILFISMAGIIYTVYMEPFANAENIANIDLFFTVYAIAMLCARPMSGRLTDKFGALKIVIPACVLYAASFVVIGTAHTLPPILIGGALAALGYGAAQPAIQTMAMRSVPAARRGAASNTNYFGIDLGFFLGPTIAGFVVSGGGYQQLFLLTIIPVILSALILLIAYKPYKAYLERKNSTDSL